MNKIFQAIVKIINQISQFCWLHKASSMLVLIICFIYESILNPQGFINYWICSFIDLVVLFLPTTPGNMKLTYILHQFTTNYAWIGSGIIIDVVSTPLFMLSSVLLFKMIKFIRG